jgi:hypothetical protein
MRLRIDDFERAEQHIRRLPGGREMCDRIRATLVGESNTQDATEALWTEIRFRLVYCAGFPASAFGVLCSGGDFDIRWPLTFALWYFADSGASVNELCANFLAKHCLWKQALQVLSEYPDDWRQQFEQLR